jgi:hypothetical protein
MTTFTIKGGRKWIVKEETEWTNQETIADAIWIGEQKDVPHKQENSIWKLKTSPKDGQVEWIYGLNRISIELPDGKTNTKYSVSAKGYFEDPEKPGKRKGFSHIKDYDTREEAYKVIVELCAKAGKVKSDVTV